MTTVGLALTQPVSAEHHHEHIAMSTEKKLINIELDVLLEKFAELTKRVHQLDLERISMEVEIDFESNEAEQAEISRQVKRISVLQDRLEEKRHQTRDKIHELSHRLAEVHGEDEGHEEEEAHSEAEALEEEIHHLRQEIEDLREAGKLDRAEQLQHRGRNSWSISPSRNTVVAEAAANGRSYASTSSICRPSAGRHAHISRS